MGLSLGGINANFNVAMQKSNAKSGQSGTPAFAHNHTWSSVGEMEKAFRSYGQEWRGVYSNAFSGSGSAGDGKLTQEELAELLQSEFGGMGATFVDSAPSDVTVGKHQIYIDQKNLQKMADDPEYRAQVFSVIQIEMAGTKGFSVQGPGGVNNSRLTGSALSIAEGNPLYEGVPHSGMGTAAPSIATSTFSSGGGGIEGSVKTKKSKSMMEAILEIQEEKLEKKREKERQEAAKKVREELLGIDADTDVKVEKAAAEEIAPADGDAAVSDEQRKAGGGLDVLA